MSHNECVNDRAQALLLELLALPADERANVAAELLASLDDSSPENPAAVQAAWAKEIERRARRVLAGESSGQPWDEVRDRVARRLENSGDPSVPH
jgi:putative addiction module component (TIGR02574 family)